MNKMEIVISGISGKFPESGNIKEFEENLFNGVDMITDDGRRWSVENDVDFDGMPTRCGKLKELDKFDHLYFSVHGKQAEFMDPQLRLLHELTHEAIVDAGVNPSLLRGSKTGVFIGASLSESEWMLAHDPENKKGYDLLGCTRSMFANRLSFSFDFHGPSYNLDTACSSSLLALEQALTAIRQGECDNAIVGGVHLCLSPQSSLKFHRLNMLSPEGKCKAFDAEGNGYVRSEAAVVVFIQKKDAALRSYAEILHAKTSTDGYKDKGVTFPSGERQAKLLEQVYEEAGVDPREVAYVEAHGTGTPVGDPQEMNAITQVFCKEGRERPLLVGSVKSNMGHSEPSSGLCSVAKVLISLQRGEIPANLHFKTPNPNIPALNDGRIKVVSENTPFQGDLIGINSFGFGGCNVHAIFKANPKKNQGTLSSTLPLLIPYSGRTSEAVEFGLKSLCENNGCLDQERVALFHELSCHGDFPGHSFKGYAIYQPKDSIDNLIDLQVKEVDNGSVKSPPVWFIFSGMGSQWEKMGVALMEIPIFAQSIQKSAATLKTHNAEIDLNQIFSNSNGQGLQDNIVNTFVSIVSVQVALVDLLTSLQIRPDGIIGHSVGELACAYADGCFTAEQTILAAFFRGQATQAAIKSTSFVGAMAAVGMTWEEAKEKCPAGIYPACHNSIDSVTVSGPLEKIEQFVQDLQQEGIFARLVQTNGIAFHSKYIQEAGPIFKEKLETIIPEPNRRSNRWISSSVPENQWDSDSDLATWSSPSYHSNNVVSPVLFHEALQHVPKNAVVIEIGPHFLLQSILKRELPECASIGLMNKNAPDQTIHLMNSIGKLYTSGLNPDVRKLYNMMEFPLSSKATSISPLIKWNHSNSFKVANFNELMELRKTAGETTVEISLKTEKCEFYSGHKIDGRVIFPATGYILLVWDAFAKIHGYKSFEECPIIMEKVKIQKATIFPENGNGNPVKFLIQIFKETGEFQIGEKGSVNVSGVIRLLPSDSTEFIPLDPMGASEDSLEIPMSAKDVYKELRLRGYEYSGVFQGIQQFNLCPSGGFGEVEFSGNWTSFLDTILQILILCKSTRALYLPTFIDKMIVDPVRFLESRKIRPEKVEQKPEKDGHDDSDEIDQLLDEEEELPPKTVRVSFYENLQLISCEGVEIQRCSASMAQKREQNPMPPSLKFEKREFTPYFDNPNQNQASTVFMDKSSCLRTCIDILMENSLESKIHMTEFYPSGNPENSVVCEIHDLIFDQPSRSCSGNLVSIPKSDSSSSSDSGFEMDSDSDSENQQQRERQRQNSESESEPDFKSEQEEKLMKEIDEFGIELKTPEDPDSTHELIKEMAEDDLVVLSGLNSLDFLDDAASTLKMGAFLLIHLPGEIFNVDQNLDESQRKSLEKSRMICIAHKIASDNSQFFLLRKDESVEVDAGESRTPEVLENSEISEKLENLGSSDIFIKIDLKFPTQQQTQEEEYNLNYSWIEKLQSAMKKARESPDQPFRIFLIYIEDSAENTPPSGIIGLMNSLRHERGGEKLRCFVFLKSRSLKPEEQQNYEDSLSLLDSEFETPGEKFSLKSVLHLDLVMNVFNPDSESWGSFRFFPIKNTSGEKMVEHGVINVKNKGDLSSLKYFESPLALHKDVDESSICSVYYAPLNFRDVMIASGKLPLDSLPNGLGLQDNVLGLEFSGKLPSGERVMGLVPSQALATSLIPVKDTLYKVPENWTLAQAATIPVAYSTAFYALVIRGKIQKGESVLIHAGAGAVGQASIAIALSLDCTVYTTVGSPQKRQYLQKRFPQLTESSFANSRDTTFLQHIMEQTQGRGVDLVLNSLSEEKLQASIKCLAQHGRFLEIGKLDLFQNSELGLAVLLKNVSVHGILLDSLQSGDEDQKRVWHLVNEGLNSGVVQPLEFTKFSDSDEDIEKAFRFLSSGKHIGKVLIEVRKEEQTAPSIPSPEKLVKALPRTYFDPEKVHILVGGLGGFGLELCSWMIHRGARKIVMTSRSGLKNGYQAYCLKKWGSQGAQVMISTIDVSTRQGAHSLFEQVTTTYCGASIGGVWNLGMVLSDGLFENQSVESFQLVSRPKINATMALDQVSRTEASSMEHFICFSSAYSSRGDSGGLSNYAWSNAAMEQICEERMRAGFPALSIPWGPIGDVGVLQETGLNVGNEYFVGGMKPQRISSCLSSLDILLSESKRSNLSILTSLVIPKRGRKGADGNEDGGSDASNGLTLMERVGNILGMKSEDLKSVKPDTKLTEVGMDSLMAVEVRQLIEMRAGQQLSSIEILNLTFGQIQDIMEKMGTKKEKGHPKKSNSKSKSGSKSEVNSKESNKNSETSKKIVKIQKPPDTSHKSNTPEDLQGDLSGVKTRSQAKSPSIVRNLQNASHSAFYYAWAAGLLFLGGIFWVISTLLRKVTQFYLNKFKDPSILKLVKRPYDSVFAMNSNDSNIAMTMKCSGIPCRSTMLRTMNDRMFKNKTNINLDAGSNSQTFEDEYEPYSLLKWRLIPGFFFYFWRKDIDFNPGNHLKFDYLPQGANLEEEARKISGFYHSYKWVESDQNGGKPRRKFSPQWEFRVVIPHYKMNHPKEEKEFLVVFAIAHSYGDALCILHLLQYVRDRLMPTMNSSNPAKKPAIPKTTPPSISLPKNPAEQISTTDEQCKGDELFKQWHKILESGKAFAQKTNRQIFEISRMLQNSQNGFDRSCPKSSNKYSGLGKFSLSQLKSVKMYKTPENENGGKFEVVSVPMATVVLTCASSAFERIFSLSEKTGNKTSRRKNFVAQMPYTIRPYEKLGFVNNLATSFTPIPVKSEDSKDEQQRPLSSSEKLQLVSQSVEESVEKEKLEVSWELNSLLSSFTKQMQSFLLPALPRAFFIYSNVPASIPRDYTFFGGYRIKEFFGDAMLIGDAHAAISSVVDSDQDSVALSLVIDERARNISPQFMEQFFTFFQEELQLLTKAPTKTSESTSNEDSQASTMTMSKSKSTTE